jgi:signal peptidase I
LQEQLLSLPTAPFNGPDPAPAAEPVAKEPAQFSLKAVLREVLETIVLTVVIYAVVNFATGRFKVEGSSMEPSVLPNEYVLVDKLSYLIGQPRRGDVVVFNYPLATERDFIKRIMALPGETITLAGGVVSIDGRPLTEPYIAAPPASGGTWKLGPNQYFVMGDNRNNSSDSRSWGPLDRKYLIGKALLTYWPPQAWSLMPHVTYASTP